MSTQHSSDYRVLAMPWTRPQSPYCIVDFAGEHTKKIDWFNSRSAAEHSANMLNRGIAVIDPHAIVGCKVVAR